MKMERKIIIVLGICLLISLLRSKSNRDKANELKGLYTSINDSLKVSTNKLGQERGKVKALKGANNKAFLSLETKDSTINWLQKTVKKYKGRLNSALVMSNKTITEGVHETKITERVKYLDKFGDSLKTPLKTPVYFTDWSNKWETGFIRAGADSIQRSNIISNEYEFTLGEGRSRWFKKREYKASILNLNPNTKTKELRSFTVKAEPKRLNFGLNLSYGLNTFYDPKEGYMVKRGFHFGAGVNYTIFSIK